MWIWTLASDMQSDVSANRARVIQVLARHRRRSLYFFISGIAFLIIFKRPSLQVSETLKARHVLSQQLPRRDPVESCKPQLQLAFAKTHKTGSSTLQNIIFRWAANNLSAWEKNSNLCISSRSFKRSHLLRHGERHNLAFAFPEGTHVFSYRQPFHPSLMR